MQTMRNPVQRRDRALGLVTSNCCSDPHRRRIVYATTAVNQPRPTGGVGGFSWLEESKYMGF